MNCRKDDIFELTYNQRYTWFKCVWLSYLLFNRMLLWVFFINPGDTPSIIAYTLCRPFHGDLQDEIICTLLKHHKSSISQLYVKWNIVHAFQPYHNTAINVAYSYTGGALLNYCFKYQHYQTQITPKNYV